MQSNRSGYGQYIAMPSEDYMSDDYVANLLAKDAKDISIKYSALGLQALLPKR